MHTFIMGPETIDIKDSNNLNFKSILDIPWPEVGVQ